MRKLLFWLWLTMTMPVFAANHSEQQIVTLEAAVAQLQQEQQTLFQQFQMLQELRRHEMTLSDQTYTTTHEVNVGGEAPRYEDAVQKQRESDEKIQRYTRELNDLYTRYQEVENERNVLIEQIKGLQMSGDSAVN